MRAVCRSERGRAVVSFAVLVASAMLLAGPGNVAAQSPGASDQASSDAKSPASQGPAGAPKSPPRTAGEVGDRLHDRAKGFGEALLDGIRYAGNKVVNFLRDDTSQDEATSRK